MVTTVTRCGCCGMPTVHTENDELLRVRELARKAQAQSGLQRNEAERWKDIAIKQNDEIAELREERDRLQDALKDVISGIDGARAKIRAMMRKEVFVEDVMFWMEGWLEQGTPSLLRARAALKKDKQDE